MSSLPRYDLGRFKAVAIASSTGGPALVEQIVAGLPADLPLPIFVAQHMPPQFTASFSARMDLCSPLTVVHAQDGMPVYAATVYLGRGHHHLRVRRSGLQGVRVVVCEEPRALLFKPSADELFRSCVEVYGSGVLAVVMTGIGRDGTQGAAEVRDAGGVVLTQTRSTCAVYGMPRSCVEAGLSDAQLDVDQIRRVILQMSPRWGQSASA